MQIREKDHDLVGQKQEVEKLPSILEYLRSSLNSLERLYGAKIKNLCRLCHIRDVDVLYSDEPLLLETEGSDRFLICLDEGTSNIFFLNDVDHEDRIRNSFSGNFEILSIVSGYRSEILHEYCFDRKIDRIRVVGREHDYENWCLMSGIELSFSDGKKILIGTILTEFEIQGVWIIRTHELSSGWNHFDLKQLNRDRLRSER